MKYLFTLFTISILFLNTVVGQYNAKKDFNDAYRFIRFNNYADALKPLLRVNKDNPDNANVNYLVGLCYINSDYDKAKAIPFLKKATQSISKEYEDASFKEMNAHPSALYLLGKAYHYNYQFDKAIESYASYQKLAIEDKSIDVKHVIQTSENAKILVKEAIEVKITNIGAAINSKYDEHTPVINADESMLVFTSRRDNSTGGIKTDDGKYYEDIYVSYNENNNWSEPVSISENINTESHDATIALSPDGQELFIYKDDFGIGNIYYSKLDSNIWTRPEKLGSNINTTSNETHASFTDNILYFVSDRKEGHGGTDIYIVKRLPNGEWSWAQNIGDVINTPYDEGGPYIHPDGHTLYFSSKGHNSMGGYDLFSCELQENGTWSKPKNMRYPINTVEDDIYFVISADGRRAYYSSISKRGYGGRDISIMHMATLPERSTVVVKGVVMYKDSDEVPKDITISIYDAESDKLIGTYKPNKQTGKYLLILHKGKEYKLTSEAQNCKFLTEKLNIPQNATYFELKRPIYLDPIGTLQMKE